jgi:Domain of unknown function (DUF4124)
MGKTTLISVFFWLVLSSTATASTLYRCVDESNHATYTNYKGTNRKCTVLSREDSPRSNSSNAPKSSSSSSTRNPSPADFPKVASATQKSRDGDRRYILEQELSAEQKNLDEARKSLADQLNAQPAGAGPERTQPARDRIALHQRNLDALRREISNLK